MIVRKLHVFRGRRLSSSALFLRISAVQSHYWRTKLWTADKYLLCHPHDQIRWLHQHSWWRSGFTINRGV